jgi:hypothetical protein
MAADKVWIVNGQEYVPVNDTRPAGPVQYYYVQQRAPVALMPVEPQPHYYTPPPQPSVVVYQPPSHDGAYIVAGFLALLVMLICGMAAVLFLALVASGRLF